MSFSQKLVELQKNRCFGRQNEDDTEDCLMEDSNR